MHHAKQAVDALLGAPPSPPDAAYDFMERGVVSMLEAIDDSAFPQKIEQLVAETLPLNMAALRRQFREPLTAQNALRFAEFAVQQLNDDQIPAVLASAEDNGFRHSESASPRSQLEAYMDARINSLLVEYSITGLKAAIRDGHITEAGCRGVVDRLSAFSKRNQSDAVMLEAFEKQARSLHANHPDAPIYYASIGCGSGKADCRLFAALKTRLPDIDLRIIGFDPFQSVARNPIIHEQGGVVLSDEIAPNQTYIDAIRKHLKVEHPLVIGVERYALHHMHRTADRLLEDLEHAPLVSLDHPITKEQRLSFAQRTAMICYDLLANQVYCTTAGGTWIPSAMANPDRFNILYRREEDLQQQEDRGIDLHPIEGKKPASMVIAYPPNIELSQAVAYARKSSHAGAALSPPGGRCAGV